MESIWNIVSVANLLVDEVEFESTNTVEELPGVCAGADIEPTEGEQLAELAAGDINDVVTLKPPGVK